MKKLYYIIYIGILMMLLAGCRQEKGILEYKDELIAVHYNVSLENDISSRSQSLAINELICAVFENDIELYREIVEVEDGKASFIPKLIEKTDYKIVFWAYHKDENSGKSCYNLNDLTEITINENYCNSEIFNNNTKKDAFTFVDKVNLSQNQITKSVKLIRPFGQINVLTSEADFNAAQNALGNTPQSILTISGHKDVYDALNQEWNYSIVEPTITLHSTVLGENKSIDGLNYRCLANEYLFSGDSEATCLIRVYGNNSLIYKKTVRNMPIKANVCTNMFNENLFSDFSESIGNENNL